MRGFSKRESSSFLLESTWLPWGQFLLPLCTTSSYIIIRHSFQIAPYWIQTPPTIVSLTVNQPLQLSASALGKEEKKIYIFRCSADCNQWPEKVVVFPRILMQLMESSSFL